MSTILVPYDFNLIAEEALHTGAFMAKQLNYKLLLLYIYENHDFLSKKFGVTKEYDQLIALNDFFDELTTNIAIIYNISIDIKIGHGKVFSTILEVAETNNVNCIVMGSHCSNYNDPVNNDLPGYNSTKVVNSAKCPVLTVTKKRLDTNFQYILLPLDLSPATQQKISWAKKLAQKFKCGIYIISALWSEDNDVIKQLEEQIDKVKENITNENIVCKADILKTSSGEENSIIDMLNYIDNENNVGMIVIMTHSDKGLFKFFRKLHTQEFINHSKIPVMSLTIDTDE